MTKRREPSVVGVLHPGQMGAAVAAQARRCGATVLWCADGRSLSTTERAASAGVEPAADLSDLLRRADIVLSICPPAAAEDVAGEVANHGYDGTFVEANAISPQRFGAIAKTLAAAGARVVDGSIIGPPPSEDAPARLYLAGAAADVSAVRALFAVTALETVAMDGPAGSASALKMAYGGYQKASRALAGVAHALAAEHGVADHLLAEGGRITRSPLADLGWLPSVAGRAWRWAPEMLEVADTLADAGLPPHLSLAAAEVLHHWRDDKDDSTISPDDVLAHLRVDDKHSTAPSGKHAARAW